MTKLAPIAKAVVGALVAGLTAILTALPDGITTAEWISAAIATLTVGGGVYAAPKNRNENNPVR